MAIGKKILLNKKWWLLKKEKLHKMNIHLSYYLLSFISVLYGRFASSVRTLDNLLLKTFSSYLKEKNI